jgi:hypothetical protein
MRMMIASFLVDVALDIEHRIYYSSLDATLVGSTARQE